MSCRLFLFLFLGQDAGREKGLMVVCGSRLGFLLFHYFSAAAFVAVMFSPYRFFCRTFFVCKFTFFSDGLLMDIPQRLCVVLFNVDRFLTFDFSVIDRTYTESKGFPGEQFQIFLVAPAFVRSPS